MRKKKLRVLQCRIIRSRGEELSCYLTTLEEGTNKKREQHILIGEDREVASWNCTCAHGSVWRFSKKWLGLDNQCQHIKRCIEHLTELGYFYI